MHGVSRQRTVSESELGNCGTKATAQSENAHDVVSAPG